MHKKLKLVNLFITFLFLITLFGSLLVSNLFYDTTQSPDFSKYRNYLNFFNSSLEFSNIEQGNLYFFIVSKFIDINSSNLNLYNYEEFISNRIQLANFTIYVFSLLPLFFVLKKYNFRYQTIISSFIVLNLFPPMFALRLIFKPEILIFCQLIWCLYFVEKFLTANKKYYLICFLLFFASLITIKVTGTIMVLLFFMFFYFKKILIIEKKNFIKYFFIFIFFFSIFSYENYLFNNKTFFQTNEVQIGSEYEYTADLTFFTRMDYKDILNAPYMNETSPSFIKILLLETFDDYFKLYWNSDESSFQKDNIEILHPFLKNYIGVLLTVIFYFSVFYYSQKYKQFRKFTISPIIGITVMVLISLIVIFNPNTGDMMKNYYYAFFLNLSAIFASCIFFERKNILSISTFLLVYIISILFIFGFPKSLTNETYYKINEQNRTSPLCEVSVKLFSFVDSDCYETEDICIDVFRKTTKPDYVNGNLSFVNLNITRELIFLKNENEFVANNFSECLNFFENEFQTFDLYKTSNVPYLHLLPFISILIYRITIFKSKVILKKNS